MAQNLKADISQEWKLCSTVAGKPLTWSLLKENDEEMKNLDRSLISGGKISFLNKRTPILKSYLNYKNYQCGVGMNYNMFNVKTQSKIFLYNTKQNNMINYQIFCSSFETVSFLWSY